MKKGPDKEEILFEVKSSQGKIIRTTESYWQKIVKNKHPKIAPHITDTIKEGELVWEK